MGIIEKTQNRKGQPEEQTEEIKTDANLMNCIYSFINFLD